MPTDFNKNTTTSKGGFKPTTTDTPIDVRTRVETEADIMSIPRPYVGMVVYVKDTGKRYEILSLKDVKSGMTTIKDGAVNEYREIASSNEIEEKINEILMSPSEENEKLWENLKILMEQPTLVEGIQRILEGKQQEKVLGITPDDIGKFLTVAQNPEDNEMMVKAIDNILAGKVVYEQEEIPEVTNVESALDKLFEIQKNCITIDDLIWDKIMNKPEIPTGLAMTNNALVMTSDEGEMSSVPLVSDEDINNIVSDLEI